MERYIDLEEFKRRIQKYVKTTNQEEKELVEWCKDECIRQAYCMPITYVARNNEWISIEDRLPTEDEYLTHHTDGLDTLKRLLIAYQTDTIEYQIGCYDGWKWMNQLGNRVIKDVVAWKPFETYEPPNTKGEDQCT